MDELKNTQNPDEKFNIRPLRTYEEDVASFVKKGQISTSKIVLAEQKRQQEAELMEKVETQTNRASIALKLSIGLVVFGIIITTGIIYFTGEKQKIETPKISISDFRDVLIDKKTKIPVYVNDKLNSEIKKQVADEMSKTSGLAFSEITEIQLLNKSIIEIPDKDAQEKIEKVSIEEFFKFLEFRPEESMIRAMDKNYLFGMIGTNAGPRPFLLIRTLEYQRIFAGMLNWEKSMFREINDIFFQTLSTNDFLAEQPKFTDIIIFNRDVRAILDENGQTDFFYTFVNNDHLLLSTEKEVIEEIYKKLSIQNIVR